ncbi:MULTISPECIES: hypothetical protein [Kitasatospora]|uniref:DUF5709 domain-containing protein n=1 Tax=Kitasatospora setae (strain ATCC 33774 / DSM 43861 / JCM 3304 / KCC A-0304 / NBRC 14216 / KM-6054) TaxID=452652 RepID=E4NDR3_KITSK|nr:MULTISPECIES: hypothetical protein [Kitasatospora]BAJ29344.1 hypothetical protein KSE_35380 [Kitasatospora setae KM-6054]
MRVNAENPEYPEDEDELSPAVLDAADQDRAAVEPEVDDLEVLRQRRDRGAEPADEGDAVEQVREVPLEDEDYRE